MRKGYLCGKFVGGSYSSMHLCLIVRLVSASGIRAQCAPSSPQKVLPVHHTDPGSLHPITPGSDYFAIVNHSKDSQQQLFKIVFWCGPEIPELKNRSRLKYEEPHIIFTRNIARLGLVPPLSVHSHY